MTGTQYITEILGALQTLKPGGGYNSSQGTLYLRILNQTLSLYEADGRGGFSVATNVLTMTAISRFASESTDNTYPSGWELALVYRSAATIALTEGDNEDFEKLNALAIGFESRMLTLPAIKNGK